MYGYNETFYVMVVTRGAVRKWYKQKIQVKCGGESIRYNTTLFNYVI